jgi:O-antigen/teichoic acid export membrane protein
LLLLLGRQWTEAADLVRILACAALVAPISGTTSWLLTTQGRGKDLFCWGFADAGLKLAALSLGLRWGIKGLAIAVAGSFYLGFVLYAAFVGRKGPVTSRHLYKLAMRPFVAVGVAVAAGLYLRGMLADTIPIFLVFISGLVTSLVVLAVTWLWPGGRASLREGCQMGRDLLRGALRLASA